MGAFLGNPFVTFPAVGGGGFDPSDYGTVKYWFDVSKLTGLVDTDAIIQATDYSGNSAHFTQGTDTSRGVYKTGIQNGKPGMLMDTGDFYTNATFSQSQNFHVFFVIQPSALQSCRLLADTTNDYYCGLSNDRYRMAGSFGTGVTGGNTSYAVDGTFIAEYIISGASSTFYSSYKDADVSVSIGTGGISGANLFKRVADSAYFQGYVFEIVVFDGVLGSTDRTNIKADFATTWGL